MTTEQVFLVNDIALHNFRSRPGTNFKDAIEEAKQMLRTGIVRIDRVYVMESRVEANEWLESLVAEL